MTQLDLQQKLEQLEAERDALQQQVNALAAENVIMLRLLTDISESHEECTHEDQMHALIPLEYVSDINGHVARDIEGENPFAATDAIKRQWMADSAKSIAQHFDEHRGGSISTAEIREYAEVYYGK